MTRIAQVQTNFTGGEWSPRMRGRVDVSKYFNATSSMLNFVPKVQGGAKRRGGIRFVHEVANSANKGKLVPFVFSRAQSYQLEFGNLTMRVFKDGGIVETSPGVPFSLVTPYASADLPDLHYSGLADTMFLFHPGYATRKLSRRSHTDWKLVAVPWFVQPFDEQGIMPAATLTLDATTGTLINFTASVSSFLASDVGRQITSGDGTATITAYTSTTVVVCTIVDNFAAVGPIASQSWALKQSPFAGNTPSAVGLGAAITMTLDAAGWRAGDVGSYVQINDGVVEIMSLDGTNPTTVANGIVRSTLTTAAKASAQAWTLEQKVWNAANGYPRCGTIFEQRLYAAGSSQYPQTIWGSKCGQFYNMTLGANANDGVNFTIASNEANQIEHLGSISDLIPLTYGGEFRMYGGSDTAITPTNVRIKSQSAWGCSTLRPVRVGNDVLYVTRSSKRVRSMFYQFTQDIYVSNDITLLSDHITGDGLVDFAYQQDPDTRLWAARSDGLFLACAYSKEQDVIGWARQQTDGSVENIAVIPYGASDQVWVLAALTIGGATKRYIGYIDDTLNTDWAVTGAVGSSAIAGVSYAAGVLTVHQFAHGYTSGDRVKLQGFVANDGGSPSVDTSANINVTRTITTTGLDYYTVTLTADPGTITTIGVGRKGVTAWSGLSHLEGKIVDVVADGALLTPQVVSGGAITIDRPGMDVEIGLHYSSSLTLMPTESQAFGTVQGRIGSVYEVVIRLLNSSGLQIDGKEIEFMQHGSNVLDNPAPLFTGDKVLEKLTWERSGGAITIEQPYPLPCEILAVIRKTDVEA